MKKLLIVLMLLSGCISTQEKGEDVSDYIRISLPYVETSTGTIEGYNPTVPGDIICEGCGGTNVSVTIEYPEPISYPETMSDYGGAKAIAAIYICTTYHFICYDCGYTLTTSK